jgi:hypothetical protein
MRVVHGLEIDVLLIALKVGIGDELLDSWIEGNNDASDAFFSRISRERWKIRTVEELFEQSSLCKTRFEHF